MHEYKRQLLNALYIISLYNDLKENPNLEMQPKQKEEFYPFVLSCPNVLECNCVTGHYSMLLKVAFKSTEELDLFIGKLQHFGNTETQIVFSQIKSNYAVDIAKIEE